MGASKYNLHFEQFRKSFIIKLKRKQRFISIRISKYGYTGMMRQCIAFHKHSAVTALKSVRG